MSIGKPYDIAARLAAEIDALDQRLSGIENRASPVESTGETIGPRPDLPLHVLAACFEARIRELEQRSAALLVQRKREHVALCGYEVGAQDPDYSVLLAAAPARSVQKFRVDVN